MREIKTMFLLGLDLLSCHELDRVGKKFIQIIKAEQEEEGEDNEDNFEFNLLENSASMDMMDSVSPSLVISLEDNFAPNLIEHTEGPNYYFTNDSSTDIFAQNDPNLLP